MSVETSVQAYLDQVESGEYNRSSVGEKYAHENDSSFREVIKDVATDEDLFDPFEKNKAHIIEGCRAEILDRILEIELSEGELTVSDVIQIIRDELQMWEAAPVHDLEWKVDHMLNLRELSEDETEMVITVRKSFGTQQIGKKFPFSVDAIRCSWRAQANNWSPVPGMERKTDDVYTDERDLLVRCPNSGEALGIIRWKLIHNDPDGDTTSDDSLELVEL
ncbi:hypothetical protein HOF56_02230 [Candidatus Peribacteria bacterium]|jgi:hypothetical protein|nr:hypothetical protein [Candidatus Peribacteria bacterium]MBT4021457.1 hypothetical protein [Candidatus Peribacteria bacterium]MBT4240367.1 hypothetical protein [Candidatus Peribacteria bacterium]MBT4473790.1 hypothetical protein [Candidatus Peribacteria bacterium]